MGVSANQHRVAIGAFDSRPKHDATSDHRGLTSRFVMF
jgi:hypothetical protein